MIYSDNVALITVTTPSYNRAHTLPNVYESLCNQTDKRFKWLIIDDGSTDETEALVSSWIAEGKFPIMYKKKANGGKASALNIGIDLLDTPYAVCLDSDDTFYSDTIENAIKNLEKIVDNDQYCGILALRNNPDGSVMGGKALPYNLDTITAVDVFMKLNLNTELICFYKTSILTQYRFPEFEGEKFVSPAWMQYEITQKYHYLPVYEKYCCCEYIADGLTRNKRTVIKKNPRGYTAVKRYSFNLAPSLRLCIKHGIMYDCGCLLGKEKNWMQNTKHPLLSVILMPVAIAVKKLRFSE